MPSIPPYQLKSPRRCTSERMERGSGPNAWSQAWQLPCLEGDVEQSNAFGRSALGGLHTPVAPEMPSKFRSPPCTFLEPKASSAAWALAALAESSFLVASSFRKQGTPLLNSERQAPYCRDLPCAWEMLRCLRSWSSRAVSISAELQGSSYPLRSFRLAAKV